MMITRHERRWAWVFGFIVMLFTSIPYLIGFAAQGQDWVFSGFVFGIEDGNSYLAKMLNGYYGDWLFRTPYSTEPQSGLLVLFTYIFLGKFLTSPVQHIQMIFFFHAFRFVAGLLVFPAAYSFLSVFIHKVSLRRLGVAVATLGGGLGWLLVLVGQGDLFDTIPLDFYSPESFGFLSLYGIPHLALTRALLLWGLAIYLSPPLENVSRFSINNWFDRRGALIGALWLLMGIAQVLTVTIGYIVLAAHLAAAAVWQLSRRRKGLEPEWGRWRGYLKRAFSAGLISSPMVLYTIIAFANDPFAKAWTAQNLIISPHPLHYLFAYGLMLPLAWIGVRRLLDQDQWIAWLPIAWLLLLPILVYAPVNIQRRLADGVWLAWVVLAVMGIESQSKLKYTLYLVFPSSIFLLTGGILAASNPADVIFHPAAEVRFFEQAAQAVTPDAVVLAAYKSGNALPAWAPVQMIIGHGPETINLDRLEPRVNSFFEENTPDVLRFQILAEFNVKYVLWGPRERLLGNWSPDSAAYLDPIVSTEEYTLYRVSPNLAP